MKHYTDEELVTMAVTVLAEIKEINIVLNEKQDTYNQLMREALRRGLVEGILENDG